MYSCPPYLPNIRPQIRFNFRCKINSIVFEIGEREFASNSDITAIKFRNIVHISGQMFTTSLFRCIMADNFKNTNFYSHFYNKTVNVLKSLMLIAKTSLYPK